MSELGLLYRYLPTELAPPEEMWGRIMKVLDDDDERDAFGEMSTLVIEPPTSAWENIALGLDEKIPKKNYPSFADKFLDAEITPPVFVWGEIEKSLDADLPVKKIGGKSKVTKMIIIGLAIAASITGIVFFTYNADNQPINKNVAQIATTNRTNDKPKENKVNPKINITDSQGPQTSFADERKTESPENKLPLKSTELETESEREFNLEKYKTVPVADINTTNNKVANKTGKLKDAFGNVIDNIGDYNTGGNYIAAIGPNGNTVNVSSKLSNMIEFFQEDSTANQPEEYLDKVMRESNVWRQRLVDWRKKVDNADADPSQMNFIDIIDLIRFFEESKQ